jgi:uncharacterized iron-regulated protein
MTYKRAEIQKVFDDLDAYRNFCREFGHVFNEAHLYNATSPYGQYQRYRSGQRIVNNWKEDRRAWLAQQRTQ